MKKLVLNKMNNYFKYFFLYLVLLFNFSTILYAAPGKKIIQIKCPASISRIIFTYRDTVYNEKFIVLDNPQKKDTILSTSVALLPLQIVSYRSLIREKNKHNLIVKTFITPVNDTLNFEMSDKGVLKRNDGKFFIEDIITAYLDFPDARFEANNTFLNPSTGRHYIDSVYQRNITHIEEMYNKSNTFSKAEYALIKSVAKADYYCRLLMWAKKNKKLEDIADEVANLEKDKAEIQQSRSGFVAQLFGQYIPYLIHRNKWDGFNYIDVIKHIISIGWNKDLSFGYISYILSDITEKDPQMMQQSYDELKKYLNGRFSMDLEQLRRKILPKLSNLNKVELLTFDGKRIDFQSLLDQYSNKIILIDFWASWCVPCRQESPFFEAAKLDFAEKDIVFISISTDEDNKITAWRKAIADDKVYDTAKQFKLMTPKTNSLFDNFSLPSIPRYIVIYSTGELIDSDFPRPSDPMFKKAINEILSK